MPAKANIALLDWAGLLLATIMGAIVFVFGSSEFLLLLFAFLGFSIVVTRYGYEKKRELGIYEHERSWENVLANGLVPTICAVASPVIGWGAYVGSIAAITADKFASELGVLSNEPFSLLNFKKVKKGTSGAVTWFGMLASFDGGLLIGLISYMLFPSLTLWNVVVIGLIGLGGSFIDSLVGVMEEKGIGNKATTNAICSIFGAVAGLGFL
ncbi:MAG: DUF92 domain-containing protein [Candidatus Micrarchaeota archaeon]|nr:DUF92 domain-containing protein [Candidatus Micrarchaeota archaeon]